MRLFWYCLGMSALILGLAGCGRGDQPESTEGPTPTEPTPIQAVATPPRPTATLLPRTPQIIYIEITPTPGPPTPPPLQDIPDEEETSVTIEETPEPPATKSPPPTPTPKYRPVVPPVGVGYSGFKFTSGPSIINGLLTFSATIENQGHSPSQIQLYHSLRRDDIGASCSTDRPIAFVADGPGSGSTEAQWEFCSYRGAQPEIHVSDVPWLTPRLWQEELRARPRITSPYVYDWSVSVDLNDDQVEDLSYGNSGLGYILVIFAGNETLVRVWVDG